MAIEANTDERDVSGRVVIITGAGQGIGRQYALSFARAGAIPIIAELNEDKARGVESEIRAAGGKAKAIRVDVTDPEGCKRMAAAVAEEFGRIDVLVNNAAIFATLKKHGFEDISLDEWNTVLRVNIDGPFLCAQAVAPYMRKAKWGRIINISSSSVRQGTTNYLHYVTSKSALHGMTNALARELGKDGITANVILPSAIGTEVEREGFTPELAQRVASVQCIQRPQRPEDVVGLVMFLASPASGFVTGQAIAVNGGLTHSA
jgi:3-oxoacyl-[acyl-carrier protein] reductase